MLRPFGDPLPALMVRAMRYQYFGPCAQLVPARRDGPHFFADFSQKRVWPVALSVDESGEAQGRP